MDTNGQQHQSLFKWEENAQYVQEIKSMTMEP